MMRMTKGSQRRLEKQGPGTVAVSSCFTAPRALQQHARSWFLARVLVVIGDGGSGFEHVVDTVLIFAGTFQERPRLESETIKHETKR